VFHDDWREIWEAREENGERECARTWAFCSRVGAELFPVYEGEEYGQVAYEVPLVRFGWSFDRYHGIDCPEGELPLLALCAAPFVVDAGSRLPVLDAAGARLGRDLVGGIPDGGLTPEELHARLDGTPYAAAADFADWLWGQTGTVFLDCDDEVELSIEWSRENVGELTAQWARAKALLDRVAELTRWLDADPAPNFARLLDAALGRDPHAEYLRERRHYAFEITPDGIVPVRDDPDLALPVGAPAGR
jgi:hypothetical protein